MNKYSLTNQPIEPVPPDDLTRDLVLARPETDPNLPHLGQAGDTYTILLSGNDTNGRYCLIDMFIPPGGGPPPHRHDFEETFTLLDGEIEAIFREEKSSVRAGETVHIPANAPHSFKNMANAPARMLCICAPAGQEDLFAAISVPVATRTTPPPQPTEEEKSATMKKVAELLPKYRTEMVKG